ncbi:hypothetical protein AVEN_81604-1, partial [Araneus ventricosus]
SQKDTGAKNRSLAVKRTLDKISKPAANAAEKVAKTKASRGKSPTKKKIASKAKETGPGKNQMPPKLYKTSSIHSMKCSAYAPPTPVDIQRYNTAICNAINSGNEEGSNRQSIRRALPADLPNEVFGSILTNVWSDNLIINFHG